MRELLTIGHSNHPIETFLDLLRRHRVTALADVRSTPYSRRHPQFNRERLAAALRAAGLSYVFLGAELGGKRPGQGLADIARTAEFQAGVARLRDGAARHRVAFMCAEREPLDCHRTILVARHLKAADVAISHILADGTTEAHEITERRLAERMGTAPLPLLTAHPEAWHDAVERAYDLRSADWGRSRQA